MDIDLSNDKQSLLLTDQQICPDKQQLQDLKSYWRSQTWKIPWIKPAGILRFTLDLIFWRSTVLEEGDSFGLPSTSLSFGLRAVLIMPFWLPWPSLEYETWHVMIKGFKWKPQSNAINFRIHFSNFWFFLLLLLVVEILILCLQWVILNIHLVT